MDVVGKISGCKNELEVLELLHCAKQVLRIEHAVFVSFIPHDDSINSFRFLVASSSAWCMDYQKQNWYGDDAWLHYAATNTEPVCASSIPARTDAQKIAINLAARHGLASCYVVPAPAAGGLSRVGVLVLGVNQPNFFELEDMRLIKAVVRSLAMEIHEWWIDFIRKEIMKTTRIGIEDIHFLQLERRGMNSKEIAKIFNISSSAVNSRFQRLITKLQVPNRRAAARLAAEYGLI